MFSRKSSAILGAVTVTVAAVTLCAACTSPAASPTAATARHTATEGGSPMSTALPPGANRSPSPNLSAGPTGIATSPSIAAKPAAQKSTGNPAPAPTGANHTTAAPVHTTSPRPFSDSYINLWANVGHIQTSGPNKFTFSIFVGIGFPTQLGVTYAPATVCADGSPTVALEYLGTDDTWHIETLTGSGYSGCINVGGATTFNTALVDEEMGYGASLQVKILSASMRLTGPNGPWTATGQ